MDLEQPTSPGPTQSYGGLLGGIRCDSALVLDIWLSHHEAVQIDSQTYHDREIYECSLMCKCGIFEEYTDRLDMVNEGR